VTSRTLVNTLSIACLHAEVGEWERAAAELARATELAPAGARRRLQGLRARALRAAPVEGHRGHDATWFDHVRPWRREA
jgi:hypothetical protein